MKLQEPSLLVLPNRFEHFHRHYREFFVWELPSDPPTVPVIKLYGRCIRLHHAKAQCLMATRDYFSFSLLEHTMPNSISSVFTKHPSIIQPLVTCQNHADNLCVQYSD